MTGYLNRTQAIRPLIDASTYDGCGSTACDVRYGSLADILHARTDVRFTPQSGPRLIALKSPLRITGKEGHRAQTNS